MCNTSANMSLAWCSAINCQVSLQRTFLSHWGVLTRQSRSWAKKRKIIWRSKKKKPKPQLCSKGAWFLSKGINSLWKVLPSLLINSQAPNVWFQFKELIPLCEFKEGFWKMEHFKCLWKCKDNWKGLKVKEICYFPKSISRKNLCEWVCTCLCNTYFTFIYIWQELNELICNNHNVNGEFYLALQRLQIDLKKKKKS